MLSWMILVNTNSLSKFCSQQRQLLINFYKLWSASITLQTQSMESIQLDSSTNCWSKTKPLWTSCWITESTMGSETSSTLSSFNKQKLKLLNWSREWSKWRKQWRARKKEETSSWRCSIKGESSGIYKNCKITTFGSCSKKQNLSWTGLHRFPEHSDFELWIFMIWWQMIKSLIKLSDGYPIFFVLPHIWRTHD